MSVAHALPALLFLIAVEWGSTASMKKDLSRAATSKPADLAVSLKQDLRKNNDDYKDMRPLLGGVRNPYLGGPADLNSDLEGQGNALDNARRSNDDKADQVEKKVQKYAVTSTPVGAATEDSIPSRRSDPKFQKLHQLLDKEGLLKKFLRGLPVDNKRGKGGKGGKGGKKGKDKPIGRMGGEMGMRVFQSDDFFPPPPELLPSEELDMLAATGERIDTLKRRGRLCHRHILFPEGPKYDSKGKAYMPHHTLAIDFEFTKRPKLLLPRCCNCCAKSVLGCE